MEPQGPRGVNSITVPIRANSSWPGFSVIRERLSCERATEKRERAVGLGRLLQNAYRVSRLLRLAISHSWLRWSYGGSSKYSGYDWRKRSSKGTLSQLSVVECNLHSVTLPRKPGKLLGTFRKRKKKQNIRDSLSSQSFETQNMGVCVSEGIRE